MSNDINCHLQLSTAACGDTSQKFSTLINTVMRQQNHKMFTSYLSQTENLFEI